MAVDEREGSGQTLEPFPVPGGAPRELERDFKQGLGGTG